MLIRQAIFSGKLNSGERIVELSLARQLGLGTTSVREALYDLERQGFCKNQEERDKNRSEFLTDRGSQEFCPLGVQN